jgi:hypothetical protein
LFRNSKFGININSAFVLLKAKPVIMANIFSRYSRRSVALFWLLIIAIVIGVLIAFEQIALLYVLATLSLVALLLIVGFSDLEHIGVDGEGFGAKER